MLVTDKGIIKKNEFLFIINFMLEETEIILIFNRNKIQFKWKF